MKFFFRNLGIFLVWIGALVLIVPFFMHFQTNATLFTGGLLVVTGFIVYIVINKLTS